MSLHGALAEAVRQGKELLCGRTAITASIAVSTDFATIDAVLITHETGTAPGDNSHHFTYAVNGSTVTLYAWKNTSGSDPTLVAGTTETNVSYAILGRRRN